MHVTQSMSRLPPKSVPLLVRPVFGSRRHKPSSHHWYIFNFPFVLSSFTAGSNLINYMLCFNPLFPLMFCRRLFYCMFVQVMCRCATGFVPTYVIFCIFWFLEFYEHLFNDSVFPSSFSCSWLPCHRHLPITGTELEQAGRQENTLVRSDKTRRTGNRKTENTGINTLGIMRKMADTCRGVETRTKTGETDQGVTPVIAPIIMMKQYPMGWSYSHLRRLWWSGHVTLERRTFRLNSTLSESVNHSGTASQCMLMFQHMHYLWFSTRSHRQPAMAEPKN